MINCFINVCMRAKLSPMVFNLFVPPTPVSSCLTPVWGSNPAGQISKLS